jgi:hypothetical protein
MRVQERFLEDVYKAENPHRKCTKEGRITIQGRQNRTEIEIVVYQFSTIATNIA